MLGIGRFDLPNGHLGEYLPGYSPSYIAFGKAVSDKLWHDEVVTVDGLEVRLCEADGSTVTLTNIGAVPAVAANIQRPGHSATFTPNRNFLWIDPCESATVEVNDTRELTAGAWNAPQGFVSDKENRQ
jgi:hypothetical protein